MFAYGVKVLWGEIFLLIDFVDFFEEVLNLLEKGLSRFRVKGFEELVFIVLDESAKLTEVTVGCNSFVPKQSTRSVCEPDFVCEVDDVDIRAPESCGFDTIVFRVIPCC